MTYNVRVGPGGPGQLNLLASLDCGEDRCGGASALSSGRPSVALDAELSSE
jgi:hypothetical protein